MSKFTVFTDSDCVKLRKLSTELGWFGEEARKGKRRWRVRAEYVNGNLGLSRRVDAKSLRAVMGRIVKFNLGIEPSGAGGLHGVEEAKPGVRSGGSRGVASVRPRGSRDRSGDLVALTDLICGMSGVSDMQKLNMIRAAVGSG